MTRRAGTASPGTALDLRSTLSDDSTLIQWIPVADEGGATGCVGPR